MLLPLFRYLEAIGHLAFAGDVAAGLDVARTCPLTINLQNSVSAKLADGPPTDEVTG